MGEAKRRKALDDMYGMGKMPESARPFVLAMQEMVELQTRTPSKENGAGNQHQFFFDGALNGEPGVYDVGIPVKLVDFGEYAFTASITALAGFMGVTQFGMVMQSAETNKMNSERGSIIMMLACIDGAWFYNMLNAGENASASMPGIGNWHQGKIKYLAVSNKSNEFMTTIATTLKKSQALQNSIKASMTLEYLKEHYHAIVSAPQRKHPIGDVSIN